MELETWRLLESGCKPAAENMAVDEAVMIHHAEGSVPPTIRFYCWDPPAVSLGYFQQLKKEVDVEKCKENGVDIVRRITGGRAIYHDEELTYSLVAKEDNPRVSGSVTQSYKKIARGLCSSLNKLGAPVEMAPRPSKTSNDTAACFDAPSWYELVFENKKITGSAQTRRDGVILQHGSIPFSFNIKKFFFLLYFPSEDIRSRMIRSFSAKACSLEEALQRKVSFSEAASALKKGMEEMLKIRLVSGEMSQAELRTVERLLKEKYQNKAWNYRR